MKDYLSHFLKYDPLLNPKYAATDELIEEMQKVLNLQFSDDYKFLQKCGIGIIGDHEILRLVSDKSPNVVQVTKEEWTKNPRVPHNLYVIERLGVDSILIWQSAEGTLYLSEPGQEVVKTAESLMAYLDEGNL